MLGYLGMWIDKKSPHAYGHTGTLMNKYEHHGQTLRWLVDHRGYSKKEIREEFNWPWKFFVGKIKGAYKLTPEQFVRITKNKKTFLEAMGKFYDFYIHNLEKKREWPDR